MDRPQNPLLAEHPRMPTRLCIALVVTSPTDLGESGGWTVAIARWCCSRDGFDSAPRRSPRRRLDFRGRRDRPDPCRADRRSLRTTAARPWPDLDRSLSVRRGRPRSSGCSMPVRARLVGLPKCRFENRRSVASPFLLAGRSTRRRGWCPICATPRRTPANTDAEDSWPKFELLETSVIRA